MVLYVANLRAFLVGLVVQYLIRSAAVRRAAFFSAVIL